MIDRLPPHAPDAEKAVIGCCLTTPKESIPLAQETITSEFFFYDFRNQELWKEICELPADKVDIISITQKLKDGGSKITLEYLGKCQDAAWSSAHLPVWLEILAEKNVLRRIIETMADITADAYSSMPVKEVLDGAEKSVLAIRPQRSEFKDMRSLVKEALDKIEQKCLSQGAITGLATGLIDLDKISDGLHPGEMIVLAGYPSTGKTALAVNIAVANALAKIPCAIFSAEMRPVQLVVRSICSESRVNFNTVSTDDVVKLVNVVSRLSHAPLYIQQASGLTIEQITAQARRLKQKHDIKLVVIDYVQRLQGRGDNREQVISSISSGIKGMALELDIAVIALSQLNDDGKLRESRTLGQDGDSVWKLINEGEWNARTQPVMLAVEKCRDGETGQVKLQFLKTFTRFESASKISQDDLPQQ